MRKDIHPNYVPMKATCSCGNVVDTSSTKGSDMTLDVCSACHPFYTGKQKNSRCWRSYRQVQQTFQTRCKINQFFGLQKRPAFMRAFLWVGGKSLNVGDGLSSLELGNLGRSLLICVSK